MKTFRIKTWIRAGLAVLALVNSAFLDTPRAADGDVDLSFNPPAQVRFPQARLKVFGEFLYRLAHSPTPDRLLDDGRPDPQWRLQTPVSLLAQDLERTPFGEWAIADLGWKCYLEADNGSYRQIGRLSPANTATLFPQLDGSVVANGLTQFGPDGTERPAFSQFRVLHQVQFYDPPRKIQSAVEARAVQDQEGRFVVAGNFREVGGLPRLGLVRFLQNGRPDLDWNPAPALGITLNESNQISHFPEQIVLGPDSSIWVQLLVANPGGMATNRLAHLAADGSVLADVIDDSQSNNALIAQPDGKVIVGGRIDSWRGSTTSGLVRLLSNGERDLSFQVELGGTSPGITGLAADDQGRLWISGLFDTVNGVARTNFARVFAWTPVPQIPQVERAIAPRRVDTNDVFYLGTQVTGFPPPNLQWYQNGVPLPGATHEGLALPWTYGTQTQEFRLVAWNSTGTNEYSFAPIQYAARSPVLSRMPPVFDRPLTNFNGVTQLVPRSDGKIWIASGRWNDSTTLSPLVGRLTAEGVPDPTFGEDGQVTGRGGVEGLTPLENGGLLVYGELTELAGEPASGIALLDDQGRRVDRAFPLLDIPHVSAALPLPGGGMILAGRFTQVGSLPAHRLVRLDSNGAPDPSFRSPLERWQFVDALALDQQGRLLIAGDRIYTDVTLTNAPTAGLQRLLPDGSPDPSFQRYEAAVRNFFIEPEGTLLVGRPVRRLGTNGEVMTPFEAPNPGYETASPAFQPDHRLVLLPDGTVVFPYNQSIRTKPNQLIRWRSNGERDFNFEWTYDPSLRVQAMTGLPDGGLLLSLQGTFAATTPETLAASLRIVRLGPDPDAGLSQTQVLGNQFRANLPTQPGVAYELWVRSALNSGGAQLTQRLEGDGYVQEIVIPAADPQGFLEVRRP